MQKPWNAVIHTSLTTWECDHVAYGEEHWEEGAHTALPPPRVGGGSCHGLLPRLDIEEPQYPIQSKMLEDHVRGTRGGEHRVLANGGDGRRTVRARLLATPCHPALTDFPAREVRCRVLPELALLG